ncbi:unnamed protein product [Adineta steineri]|uniref:Uncharacterized protein n=1 Tax=Adineta steineri TaxID=433720 RepID=A0A819FB38_9BILA|nr:unnamed protein product [Adineta steineri]CAF3864016.1 unnamed protein product [Adineta steineri]
MSTETNHKRNLIIIVILFVGVLFVVWFSSKNPHEMLLPIFLKPNSTSTLKTSKWKNNRLVVIPAIWKEINWANHSSWPLWLSDGLDLFNKNTSRAYDIHLYQRIDPNSTAPYNWPYCRNVHEEAGVYLKFIHDYYYDLPDRMLFIHGNPHKHYSYPIEAGLCVRDDIYYANINRFWIQSRRWTAWTRDPTDQISFMYKCATHLLTLFGFDAEAQLNPNSIKLKDESLISTLCCAQFYVRKERIHHYTYEQWSSLYDASLQPHCITNLTRGVLSRPDLKSFGGSFEHLWHVILGLDATNMPPLKPRTNTDRCHLFRSSCKGSPCSN